MPLDTHQLKQLEQLKLRAKSEQFTREDGQLVKALIASHIELVNLLKDPDATLDDVYAYLQTNENDTASDDAASDRGNTLPQNRNE
jgi:hypothetical protein